MAPGESESNVEPQPTATIADVDLPVPTQPRAIETPDAVESNVDETSTSTPITTTEPDRFAAGYR